MGGLAVRVWEAAGRWLGEGGWRWLGVVVSAAGGFWLGPHLEQRLLPVAAAVAERVPPPAPVPWRVTHGGWPQWRALGEQVLALAHRAALPLASGDGGRQPEPVAATSSRRVSPSPPRSPQGAGGAAMLPGVPGSRPPAPLAGRALRRPGVKVAIYHTHTSEMYRRPDFQPQRPEEYHRFGSTETGVVRVGRALAAALEELGVPAVHVTTIHDYPDHAAAYARSRQTVEDLVARYPDLVLLLDVHRDAPQEGGGLMALVDGEDVARIALVVGTGPDGRSNAANLAMARRLAAVAERQFPGWMRRIITVPGRHYNQHLHPGALLVEVGSYRTWEAAAVRGARLLALVVAEVVLEPAWPVEPPAWPPLPDGRPASSGRGPVVRAGW